MEYELNNFLVSFSRALDFVEIEIEGKRSNHSRRVAYISLRMGEAMGLSAEELADLVSLSMLHDNGLVELVSTNYEVVKKFPPPREGRELENLGILETMQRHCIIGARNIERFPFFQESGDIIMFHHEYYDGSGYFNLVGDEIPLFSGIISFADYIDSLFNHREPDVAMRRDIESQVAFLSGNKFPSHMVDTFMDISRRANFWLDMKDDFIVEGISMFSPEFRRDMDLNTLLEVSGIFSNIIDNKSRFTRTHTAGLMEKVELMAKAYGKGEIERTRLVIAAALHDLGKLGVPNRILDKPAALEPDEFLVVQKHTYYTRMCLKAIRGFEDITEWASNHHEKLNGKGYPFGFDRERLDFNSRLIGCLDIYQAITEERPYRGPSSHSDAMKIILPMAKNGLIDPDIVEDLGDMFL